jgi:hypothetical protein
MNFFGWIRDGVRQSVLLGVSDAIEQLGTPAATEELHPSVAGFLHQERASESPRLSASNSASGSSSGQRRRLGKSLKEMGQEAQS